MKRYLQVVMLVILFGFSPGNILAQHQKYHRIQATIPNKQFQQLMLEGLEIDHFTHDNGVLIAEVSDSDLKLLRKNKIKFQFIIEDIEKNLASYNAKIDERAATTSFPSARTVATPANFGTGGTYGPSGGVTKHFTFQEMQNELDAMRTLYPNLVTVKSSIGTTDEGRSLYMVKISDNADVDEEEPEVFLNAVHHAREPIGMTQLIFFMWYALENYNTDKEIQTLLNSTEIYLVPCVNPDGYVYNATANPAGGSMWRKNRHNNGNGTFGVDNNRNYSYGWGGSGASSTTSSETYRGTTAFSEKENQAIRDFCNSRHFVSEFNNHSYGNYCIYPFSAAPVNNNPEIPLFRQLSVFLTEDNSFVYGNCQETLNYIASGEAADWAYAEQTTKQKMYGFTPEIGNSSDGFYPASSRILPLCNSMYVMNLNLLKVSTSYGLVTTSAPATVSGFSGNIPFSLKNYSIYPATYDVAVTSASPFITAIDAGKTISSSTIFETTSNQFNYTLDAGIPDGTIISFTISTNNGHHTRYDDISIQYRCTAPSGTSTTNITSSSATANWAALSGTTDYYLSYKQASATLWGSDVLVAGSTNGSFTGLAAGTAYNWRVRDVNCTNQSTVQSFTTLVICNSPSPSASSITSTGFTVSWPLVSGASSYTVQTRMQGTTTWTSSNVTATSKAITGLSTNKVYEFRVSSNCSSGASSFSEIQTVTTTYCLSNGTNNINDWIDYIQLGGISRTSSKETGGYVNTGLSTNLVRGVRYTITFSAGFTSTIYKENWKIYIDYNQDGDFNDGNERIESVRKTGAGNYTANFTVPNSALLSTTRMRVIMSRSDVSNACTSFAYGEVEDYDVNISSSAELSDAANSAIQIQVMEDADAAGINARVHPNPFSNQITISLNNAYKTPATVKLVNMYGVTIYKNLVGLGVSNHRINTSALSPGTYMLLIENGKARKTFKLVK